MNREGNITENQDIIQVRLEDVDLDQYLVSSEMVISTEEKVIDNNIEAVEPILSHNEKVTPMYGARM